MKLIDFDKLDEEVSANKESFFWIIYVLVPIFAGFLAYNSVPNESYDPDKHILIASHEASDDRRTWTVYDEWKDKRSGHVYTSRSFDAHRESEAFRIAYLTFLYGLVGCAFYAVRKSEITGYRMMTCLRDSLVINATFSIFILLSIWGI